MRTTDGASARPAFITTVEVRRVALEHAVGDVGQVRLERRIALDDVGRHAPIPQRTRHRPAHLAAAEHQYGVLIGLVDHEQRVEGSHLVLGPHHDGDAVVGEHGIRTGGQQLPAFRQGHDVEPREPSQVRVGDGTAHERCAVNRKLRNHEFLESADWVRLLRADRDAGGQVLSQPVLEVQDVGRAAEIEHVDRILVFRERSDRNVPTHLAYGQRDVGVDGIAQVRDDEPRLGDTQRLVGRGVVDLSGHHDDSVGREFGCPRRIRLDHAVRNSLIVEAVR